MTDHDSLTGAVRFQRACLEAGVKPIFGAELTLANGDHVTASSQETRSVTGTSAGSSRAPTSATSAASPAPPSRRSPSGREGLFVLSGCERARLRGSRRPGACPRRSRPPADGTRRSATAIRIEVFDHRGLRTSHAPRPAPGHRDRDRHPGGRHERRPLPDAARGRDARAAPCDQRDRPAVHDPGAAQPTPSTSSSPRPRCAICSTTSPEALDETLRIAEACEFDLDLGTYHFPEVPMPDRRRPPTGLSRPRCYEGAPTGASGRSPGRSTTGSSTSSTSSSSSASRRSSCSSPTSSTTRATCSGSAARAGGARPARSSVTCSGSRTSTRSATTFSSSAS